MDDVSMMDTTSDDELDFSTPLWKRINRNRDSSHGANGISGIAKDGKDLFCEPFFKKRHGALQSSGCSGTMDAVPFGERGSPLSEVTGNISRSPPFLGKVTLDKGNPFARAAECKAKDSSNSGGTTESTCTGDSYRAQEKQESTRHHVFGQEWLMKIEPDSVNDASGPIQHVDLKDDVVPFSRSSCMFTTERAETSGKQPSAQTNSILSGSPVKGGWRKLSPTERSRKFLNSPPFPVRHSGQSPSKLKSPGSSVHIHWDKNKRMQSTSLESRTSSPYSPVKHRTSFSSSPNHNAPSRFGIGSPILIPDTPELSGSHDVIDRKDLRESIKFGNDFSRKSNRDVLLNGLLSEGEFSSAVGKNVSSSPSSSKPLFSSLSPPARHKKGLERTFLSPSKKFKEFRLQKKEGSSERKACRSRDPVWDFVDETSSPEKRISDFSRKLDYRRKTDGAYSGDNKYQIVITSPDKVFSSRRDQHCTSTTSEDDDLPLIFLTDKNKDKADSPHLSPTDSTNSKPDAMVTSPSRTGSSPVKRRSRGSPKLVISPWRSQTSGSSGISSRTDTWNTDGQSRDGTSKSRCKIWSKEDKDDKIAHRKAAFYKVKMTKMTKKEKMKSLLAVFSSDEDEDIHPYADKKRKMEEDALGLEQIDEVAKRRRTNLDNPTNDHHGPEGSRKYESSARTKHKDTPSMHSRVKESQGLPLNRKEVSSHSGHHGTGKRNVTSKRSGALISGRMKDSYTSPPATRTSRSSTVSSPSYPNHRSAATAATFSKAFTSPSKETFSSHASESNEPAHSKRSKGKGKKRAKNTTDSGYPTNTEGFHRTSSGKGHSPDASDLPSSSGISSDPVNVVKDDSDEEIVMLDSYSYASSLVGSYSKKRTSRKKTEVKASSTGPLCSGATAGLDDERNAVSPSILEQLNQMDADEAMARKLQEEFDAEMARSVQQQGPANRSTEATNVQAESMGSCSVNVRGADQPDAGTFGNFNPHHNISIEVSSDVPVQIDSFNWNYDFQSASSLLGRPDRPPAPRSPPSMPTPRRGRPNARQRGGGGRRRNSDDHVDGGIPDLAAPARRGGPHEHHRPDMEMIWNLQHDLFPGREIRWLQYPDLNILPPPRPGRQQGRGRGRARGRRRDAIADQNDGNDYDALLQLADSLGPAVDKRLTQSSIDRLPTFMFSKEQHSGSEEETSCPICMDDYEEGAELRRLPCFHGYHKKCIDMWLKKNQDPVCPICRVEVRIE